METIARPHCIASRKKHLMKPETQSTHQKQNLYPVLIINLTVS